MKGNNDRLDDVLNRLVYLLGNSFPQQVIIKVLGDWETASAKYNLKPNLNISSEIDCLKATITYLDTGIKGYTKLKGSKAYTSFNFSINSDLNQMVASLQQEIQNCKSLIRMLKASQKVVYNKDLIKFQAMANVFATGESLGLKPLGKIGAGRGHRNPLLEFTEIITGIDVKQLRKHYALFKKMQRDIFEVEV